MKVYVLIAEIQDSGHRTYGVFDSLEKAESFIDCWEKRDEEYAWSKDDFNIEEHDVQ